MMTPNMLCPRNALSPRLLNVSTAKIGVALSTVCNQKKIDNTNDSSRQRGRNDSFSLTVACVAKILLALF